MKQLLLILSMVIAAFVAACGTNKQGTPISGKNSSPSKTLEQMEKASSDEELKALVKTLESKKDLQVPDVIQAVNRKFGASSKAVKEQPKSRDQDEMTVRLQKAGSTPEEKPTAVPENKDFQGKELDPEMTVGKVKTDSAGSKKICVGNCNVQIQIVKKMNQEGKLTSVKAYVVALLTNSNAVVTKSKLGKKTLTDITASYEASSQSMNIKMAIKENSKDILLEMSNYTYSESELPMNISFVESVEGGTGTMTARKYSSKKYLDLNFPMDGDMVSVHLINDMGVFGRNVSDDGESVQTKAGEGSFPRN